MIVSLVLLFTACAQSMAEQPKIEPLEPSTFFDAYQSARPDIAGTVAREAELEPPWLTTGRQAGQLIQTMPITVTEEFLRTGQEQYDVYCAPCHGLAGFGQGMVVQRGFPKPPNLHTIRLRQAPDGYYFDVISNGFGRMFGYGPQIEPVDRWAVIAYVRALQLSQHMQRDLLGPEELQELQDGGE